MELSSRFDAAYAFAAALHRHQMRKGTPVPYVSHLLAVAAFVLEDGGDENEAIAGLLHDSLEDQGDTYPGGREALENEIRARFGEDVLGIVIACTDDAGFVKGAGRTFEDERASWMERKQKYLNHFTSVDDRARRVSCADKLHNALCIWADYAQLGDEVWKRFRTGNAEDQIWYYGRLTEVFHRDTRLESQFRAAFGAIRTRYEQAELFPNA